MNASLYSVASVACIMLLLVDVTHQMVLESNAEDNNNATTPTTTELNAEVNNYTVPTVNITTELTEGQNCSTARGLAGSCVQRQFCEYSTYAIDLTLYMPHGYKRPCVPSEVCCPAEYLRLGAPAHAQPGADAAFGFDEDD